MLNLSASRTLFIRINSNEQLCQKIENYINKHSLKFNIYLSFCRLGRWEWFLKCDPFTKLCLVYAYLPITKAKYEEMGIDEKIFFDTMDDIRIWIDDHRQRTNTDGLYELNWIMLHLSLDIFKLGRLQFQKWFYYEKTPYSKNGKNIKFGDKVLNIHIPRGERLDYNECLKSIDNAKVFFKKYYPQYDNNKFICHSWLLYSENKCFMSESSNILKFSTLFDTVTQKHSPSQAMLWIFGNKLTNTELLNNMKNTGKYIDTSILKCDNSLQKRAIDYINNGGTLGDAFCVLK